MKHIKESLFSLMILFLIKAIWMKTKTKTIMHYTQITNIVRKSAMSVDTKLIASKKNKRQQ